jgi:hypothetical protein
VSNPAEGKPLKRRIAMRRATQLVAVVAAVALSSGLAIGGDEERTLTGSYHWTDGGRKGDLKAVFTPTGEARWNVAFYFEFSGEPHVYSGTAEGTLAGGVLKGRVLNDGRNRSFTFAGTFTEGEFRGTHAETTDDGEHATGSLSLKVPSGRAANRAPGS